MREVQLIEPSALMFVESWKDGSFGGHCQQRIYAEMAMATLNLLLCLFVHEV